MLVIHMIIETWFMMNQSEGMWSNHLNLQHHRV